MTTPLRIVSLCPSNTEILFTLGLLPYVVGIDNYSDWPERELIALPRLGPDLQIDIQKVIALQPDLVFSSLSVPGMEHVVEGIKQAGLRQCILSPHTVADIFKDMERVAHACAPWLPDIEARALDIISTLRQRVERIHVATVNVSQRPELYWEWWPKPIYSPAHDNWLTEVSQLAGARNIFESEPSPQVCCDEQRVIAANPDYFLAVWTGVHQHKVPVAKIHNRAAWQSLSCFQRNQLYILSEGLFCRPSPRLVDGLEQLVGLLHPEIAQQLGLLAPHQYAPIRDCSGRWMGSIRAGNSEDVSQ